MSKVQVFAEQQTEVESWFQKLIDWSELRGGFVNLMGLGRARAEANRNSTALLLELEKATGELEMRYKLVQKVACDVLDELERAAELGAAVAASTSSSATPPPRRVDATEWDGTLPHDGMTGGGAQEPATSAQSSAMA